MGLTMPRHCLLPLSAILLTSCNDNKGGLTVYNTPPAATISQPSDGMTVNEGEAVEFYGVVSDSQQAEEALSITWASDIDGTLSEDPADANGNVELITANLSPGSFCFRKRKTDPKNIFVRIHRYIKKQL